jgi:ribonucleoside-diphosphate reductase alpha chain
MNDHLFEIDVSRQIWESRYRYLRDGFPVDKSVQASWRRVACALAAVEDRNESDWSERFLSILNDFRFLPGGRILAGAGTDFDVTLFNCFVMGRIEDSMEGIFNGLKQGAITMQQGGGVGYDFSTLRPSGTVARRVGSIASGPVSFRRDDGYPALRSSGYRNLHRCQA